MLYSEKNWARYDEKEDPLAPGSAARAKSRSLFNEDIAGARPKVFGIGSSNIINSFAGVSSGMQDRLKQSEAPWGLGDNFDSTSYGKKWVDKTEK